MSEQNIENKVEAPLPIGEEASTQHSLREIAESLDGQSYFLGEVPQPQLLDPQAFLPLNSDRLMGAANVIQKSLNEISELVSAEVVQIQKAQKKINFWEEKIEKNKSIIQKNLDQIKKNNVELLYDKKNRDYWIGRAEQVMLDFQNAVASNRECDWAWLIKKYSLKNADGSPIDSLDLAVEELCDGESSNLAGFYEKTASQYDRAKKDKEIENNRLIAENSSYFKQNDTLQGYITNTYSKEIEPLQDGILLLKELGVKFKSLESHEGSTFGELRNWAESYLNDFLKTNSKVPHHLVVEFRKLTSIPLPADHN